ncbi:hypothetical protein [Pedobacter agri]|uniref:hypothetical protein n=1 Tax=Pedobacter agri TaxID=454586 RepID=UPI00292D988F|nr:hypothetical protein [Pedobacter agri]
MENKRNFFDLVSSQRYFHLIALKLNKRYTLSDYWNQCGLTDVTSKTLRYEDSNFCIEHRRIKTDISFYNGEKDFSLNGDGNPPYSYDLFAIEMPSDSLIILGFPFKFLAKTILYDLIGKYNLLTKASFLKCDLNKLIKHNTDYVYSSDKFNSYFSAVDLILTGDTNITSVALDGDKPLESILYRTFFHDRVHKDECMLERCAIKCELLKDLPKTKSNVHMDITGNFKLYVHGSGNNIFTIPYLFSALNELDCLKQTITNPINKSIDE